ncbi:MAG TPA: hypothetical protein VIY29_08790 [Ktedonobacteraceae bacterium]
MKMEQVKEIANAVLYEGYLLYPYRHSAIKNRQRWTIGVVYPREYSEANGSIEPWAMRTECLISGQTGASLDVHVRFLHLLVRTVVPTESVSSKTRDDQAGASEWSMASRMANEPWEEGIEREVSALNLSLDDLAVRPRRVKIEFPGGRTTERSTDSPATEIVREQQPLVGTVIIAAEALASKGANLFKLSVQIENTTPETSTVSSRYNTVLLQSLVSTHTILRVRQGSFISLLDPPEALKHIAQGCKNIRTWPVLVGTGGEQDVMLSSPIILYDYPQIAPESPGSLFDGTEIDEILALRIMTLSDEEKEEIRQGDERAREILERTEALTPEQLMKLHGTIRSLRPVDEAAAVVSRRGGSGVEAGTGPLGRPRPGLPPDAFPDQPQNPTPESGVEAGTEIGVMNISSAGSFYPGEDYPPPASVLIAGREVKAGDSVRLRPGRG